MDDSFTLILILIFSTLFGYLSGYGFRQMLLFLQPVRGACNIAKKGKTLRAYISLILLGIALWLHIPLLAFFAGFTWYESRSKWCIVQSLKVK